MIIKSDHNSMKPPSKRLAHFQKVTYQPAPPHPPPPKSHKVQRLITTTTQTNLGPSPTNRAASAQGQPN